MKILYFLIFLKNFYIVQQALFNSVRRTGGKYHYKKGNWNRTIKPLTNRLADKYHTGHLKEKDETLDYSSDYKKGKNGVDWQVRVQGDIDQCISMSRSYSDFKRKMVTEFHYQLREGVSRNYGVYLSLMPPGKGKVIRSYLGRKEDSLLEKHLCMLWRIFGTDVSDRDMDNDKDVTGQGGIQVLSNPVDRLDAIVREHDKLSGSKEKSYGQVIEFILNDSGLSAAQIEQLRLAAQAGVPEEEVLKMAKGRKAPMEIKRCVEFFQMLHSAERKKDKRRYFEQ